MSSNSPLRFVDVFGQSHIEPSVTGLIRLQETEPRQTDPVNDLILLSPFRSGAPAVRRFKSLTSLADYHDPDRTGDQGVALARVSKTGIAETDMFGAADILTRRVGAPTQSTSTVLAGATELGVITSADYGSHTLRCRRKIEAGTAANSKKITIRDDSDGRVFVSGDLGLLLNFQYTGDAAAAALTIRRSGGVITYTDQPSEEDWLEVQAGGASVAFEFRADPGTATPGRTGVEIGADADETFGNLTTAINANVAGATASQSTTANTVTISSPQEGIVLLLHTGVTFTVAATGDPASFRVALTNPTDGSADLNIPLTSQQYKSIGQLAGYLNTQLGYSAGVVSGANKNLPSSGLDTVTSEDVTTAVVLTGYMAAIADFVNSNTRGNYSMTVTARQEPDNNTAWVYFTGGSTPIVTASDWDDALTEVGIAVGQGGIILADTNDPVIMAMVIEFIVEQRTAGKWFRAYFGAEAGLVLAGDTSAYKAISASLNHTRARLVCQRVAVFGTSGALTYLDPIFVAAALAGAAAGNRPYDNPLTNKALRFADIHTDDQFDKVTREDLEDSGFTVLTKEDGIVRVALAVTTSLDPDLRMARIASEVDTVDEFETNWRLALLGQRGKWVNGQTNAMVIGITTRLAREYTKRGAFSAGQDEFGNAVPAWKLGTPPSTILAGVLNAFCDINIGGELNHISLQGAADYARLVGSVSGGVVSASTAVPIR